ncbi:MULTISPECIES: hypothetical protein [unclassified Xanthobacter]|uniref:hypothetical protein n=1 Tax=unclassified Xanthobacter TaxID=2623496 RepID=UPI001F3A13F4|nr:MULTISPECIES: hypothetical protein [unclassified Xanthobacter]
MYSLPTFLIASAPLLIALTRLGWPLVRSIVGAGVAWLVLICLWQIVGMPILPMFAAAFALSGGVVLTGEVLRARRNSVTPRGPGTWHPEIPAAAFPPPDAGRLFFALSIAAPTFALSACGLFLGPAALLQPFVIVGATLLLLLP